MLYLKILQDGEWVAVDSAEVVHGTFAFKGKVDSVMMVTLYIDRESIMPLILEKGKTHISIENTQLSAHGTPLNDALYDFIEKKNALDIQIEELDRKEARMVMEGGNLAEIHAQLNKEGEELATEMNRYVKSFIVENYNNILGPSVFMMLCSSLPYPIMTPQIDDILKDAPYEFKNHKLVKEFVTKARENKQLIEEHQRLQQNTPNMN